MKIILLYAMIDLKNVKKSLLKIPQPLVIKAVVIRIFNLILRVTITFVHQ